MAAAQAKALQDLLEKHRTAEADAEQESQWRLEAAQEKRDTEHARAEAEALQESQWRFGTYNPKPDARGETDGPPRRVRGKTTLPQKLVLGDLSGTSLRSTDGEPRHKHWH